MTRFYFLFALLLFPAFSHAVTVSDPQTAWSECDAYAATTTYTGSCYLSGPYSGYYTVNYGEPGYYRKQWSYLEEAHCSYPEVYNSTTQTCQSAPPECLSPNYIDDVSGECVPPEEICFTTIETMADQCVYIGEDDPSDEVPPGCVLDLQTGSQICVSEEPGCYIADGNTICPTPEMVCGEKNGTFSCVSPEEEGCGYFNGERVCFTPDGENIEEDSPDHPDNGGNLDGDDSNDMFDSRDPAEGGDPSDQVDPVLLPTQDADRATEATARDQLQELKNLNKKFDKLGEGGLLDQTLAGSKIDSAVPGLIDSTGIDGLTSGINANPFGSDNLGGVPGLAESLMPQGSCVAYAADILGFGTFTVSCEDTDLLRSILAWILYAITAIYCFQLLTTPVRS
ncbi:MAG: hypothetical protein WD623_02235 [Marinobacter sp.]|uniref:hypothetical protein n=1 Tax=Marinobacter sp. TaxID=50741 RepID=UPI00349FE3B7